MRILKAALLSSIAGMSLLPSSVAAQDAADATAEEDGGGIIVTARRQSERLIDVPASVAVLSADTIAKTGITNAEGFANLTPGVTIVTGTAEAGDTQINIRGINGARDAESSVALVVDGILKTNTAQLNQKQGTLRQIEILKGPQGAIYGRNAAAGAIVISTLKPGGDLAGGAKVSYANENTVESSAYVSVPFSEGTGLLLSGYYKTTDGFYRNDFLDRKVVDNQRTWALDGRFVAAIGDATELDVKARYADVSGASINFNSVFHIPALGGAFGEDVNDHNFVYNGNIVPTNEQTSFDVSAKIDHEFDSITLTAWALYSDVDQALTADGTSADFARFTFDPGVVGDSCRATTAANTGFPLSPPGFIGTSPTPFIFDPMNGSTFGAYSPTTCDGTQFQTRNQEDISAEVRIASNDGGALQWQLGAYYLNIDRETGVSIGGDTGAGVTQQLFNDATSSNPTSLLLADSFDTNVYAVFGSADYEISETFSASLALRYDIEQRDTESLVPAGAIDPFTGGPINPGLAFGPLSPISETFKQVQPKISLSWRPNDNTNIYANWGIGFKSGGFNNQGSSAIIDANFNNPLNTGINAGVSIPDQYEKETSSAFEVGAKGSLFDNRVTFDLAAYYTRITDMQFFEFFVGTFGLLRTVSNIDKVEVKGAEINLNAKIIPGWNVFGSFNVTDSEIKENSSRPNTVGNKSPYTSDYTINLGTQFDVPVSGGVDAIFRADYRITGPTWFHTVQDQTGATIFSDLLPISALALPAAVGNSDFSLARREAFGVMNGRIGLEGENWTLAVFANNLFDKEYLNEVIPAIEFGGSFASPGARRLVGLEGGFKF